MVSSLMGRVKEGRSKKRQEQLSQNQHLLQEGQAQQVGEVKVKGTLPTESVSLPNSYFQYKR